MRLKGKVAIVSGAARGLGKAYALRLAEEGDSVVVTDILDTTDTKNKIAAKGGEAMALHVDVSIEGNETFPEQSHQRAVDGRCFKRNELSEDLVGTIGFLASDDSVFITDQTIVVDGGDAFN